MVCGVLCFMVAYTLATSSVWYVRRVPGSAFGRALRWATRFRSGMAVGALIGMIPRLGGGPLMGPLIWGEVYAGLAATQLVEAFGRSAWISALRVWLTGPVAEERAASVWIGDITSIVPTFLITLVEGGLLSLVMLGLAGLFTIALRWRGRRAVR